MFTHRQYNSRCIPQGSVLGPLLFILYINDICNAIPGINVKLFADDTNLFLSGKNLVHLYSKANASLEQLFKWSVVNRLSLNIDKTCYSLFGVKSLGNINLKLKINDKKIQMVESCKYLGIFIDRSLSCKEHIDYLYKKLIKFTSTFYKIRTRLNNEVLKLLYFAFVYPHLLYGIEIYGNTNHCHLSKLEKLNNKIFRILQNRSIRTNNIELYKHYDTLPLPLLHNYQILLFLQRFYHHSYTLYQTS